ncbi:DUF6283 family protein [Kribbella sp. NPDC059898]|uniref:DUF6283 family protein n=1 Tax=Kribbella sp. NPDC059898 TaxID=3346995 RepID=UPI003668954A
MSNRPSGSQSVRPPAPRPCTSCPYRRDVPSGVWAPEEYERLRAYDRDTAGQPHAVFRCHQSDKTDAAGKLCSGWVGCHHTAELFALRLALAEGRMDVATYQAIRAYESPVPLFDSGRAAADHGQAGVEHPDANARRMISKIRRVRSDLIDGLTAGDPSAEPQASPD